MTVTLLIDIATNISLLLSLLFIQNLLIFQHDQTTIFSKSLQGVIIGVISIVLMNNSIFTHPGMIFDSRTVLLSVSGLFLGILPTIIAMFIAGVYRIWLGGTGMFVGVLSIIIATFLGIIMGRVVTNKQIRPGWRFNFAFGLAVHSIILMLFFLLFPRPDNRMITKSLAIPYLLLLPLATSLVGSLLSFQNDSRVAQKKLLDNRELFHTLFRDNHTIMLIIDPESGDIQDANESAIKFYGWSYAEMKSMNIHQINMAPQHEVFEKIGVIQKNRELNFLAQHRRADDSIRDVEVFSETIVQNENPLLFSIIHDITDRLATEKMLQKSEYQLSRAELIAKLGHWELDINKDYFNISEGAREIYGVMGDVMGMSVIQSIPLKEYREVMSKALHDLIHDDTPYDIFFEILRPSDDKKRIIHSVAQYDQDTNIVFGVIHDITEFKRAEEEIQKERELLDVTLYSIGDGVITTDNKGRIQLMNPVAEELTGWSISESLMKPLPEVFNIVDEYTRMPCQNPVDLVFKSKKIIELANHTMLISKDGRELIIADSGAPIKNKTGEIIGTVLVFRDTTEKQMIQDRIIRAEKLESLGVLAGGIAHDFNNLLAGIFGYLELARLENKNVKVSRYLDNSIKVYNRTVDLTKQLLTFSKGNILNRKNASLDGLIRDSANFSLSGSALTCSITIEEDLFLCSYDENQIGQVLDNLLINAKQAMPEGGTIQIIARNVFIHSQSKHNLPEGTYVCVSIRDSGTGITPEILPRIFDPFFSTKQKGSGLGLATCFSILERHDGSIDVQSSREGTVFSFYLPAVRGSIEKSDRSVKKELTSGGTILIMDDEPSIRTILGVYLKSIGFSVAETQDGRELLEILEKNNSEGIQYDAAILDLTIPGGMGGVETLKQIREGGYTFPVFAMSGYSEDSVISEPEKNGFTNSLSKPFKMEDLSDLLGHYL